MQNSPETAPQGRDAEGLKRRKQIYYAIGLLVLWLIVYAAVKFGWIK